MENIEKKLTQAIKPGRVNFSNLIYTYNNHLSSFHRIDFTMITHDYVQLPVSLFIKKMEVTEVLPTIIYNHSHGSSKWESSDLIQHCNYLNLNLCLYDSRGCGESSDSYIYFGFREHLDLLYLIFQLNIIYKCNEVILWGRSIGCNTVLQFYQAILSNEGSFLNARVKKLMQQGDTSGEEKAELDMFKRYQHSLRILNYSENMFSPNFNMLIDKYIDDFIEKNIKIKIQDQNFRVTFCILGIILDSPYDSFSGFVRDNMKKQVTFLSGLISTPVSAYLKSFYKKKLDIDLDKMQNTDLIKRVNLNTVMFISDDDELIPLETFNEMIQGFAEKCPKRNKCKVYNTKQKHGKKRPDDLLSTAIKHLLQNVNQTNTYRFTHCYVEKEKKDANYPSELLRKNSQAMLGRSYDTRSRSVNAQHQSLRSGVQNNNNDSRQEIPRSHIVYNNSFANVHNRNPFTVQNQREERTVAQFYKDNDVQFDTSINNKETNDSTFNARSINRSQSPLLQKYGTLGSYKLVELKQPAKNPPMKLPVQRSFVKPLVNNEVKNSERAVNFDPNSIQEKHVEIIQLNKEPSEQNTGFTGRMKILSMFNR